MKSLSLKGIKSVLTVAVFSFGSFAGIAQADTSSSTPGYTFLAPLPTAQSTTFTTLADYMVYLFTALIGFAIIMAVLMITWGGIQYVFAVVPGAKESGKKKITAALIGLLLIIFSYTLVQAINPLLLKIGLNVPQIIISNTQSLFNQGRVSITSQTGGRKGCSVVQQGYCSAENLAKVGFTDSTWWSKNCMKESGGSASITNTAARCEGDGTVFAVGLFQMNLTANPITIAGSGQKLNCPSAFTSVYGSKNHSCRVKSGQEQLYKDCLAAAKDPNNNIASALALSNGGTKRGPWSENGCSYP